MIISRGKGKRSLVPCTCSNSIRLATRIGLSFFSISNDKWTKKAELASTRKLAYFALFFSYGLISWDKTLILTPSASGLSIYLPIILTSNEKLIFEQFLKGIFIDCLLGIFMILAPERLSYNYFKQTIWGTSPREWIWRISGFS
jgi:hypothetical protein